MDSEIQALQKQVEENNSNYHYRKFSFIKRFVLWLKGLFRKKRGLLTAEQGKSLSIFVSNNTKRVVINYIKRGKGHMALIKKTEVKAGYEEIYDKAKAKLENLEAEARAKVEELIKEDREALEQIIASSVHEVEVEVPDEPVDEKATVEEVVETTETY